MNQIEELQIRNPKYDIVHTAIDTFLTSELIQQFYKEYVEYIGKHSLEKKNKSVEETANDNIRHYLKILPSVLVRERWENNIPEAALEFSLD